MALYEEPDVLVKVIRDLFNEDFTGLIVSGDEAWNTINEYVNTVAPELVPRLTKYQPAAPDGPDVFAVHRIDEQLTKAMDRKVWLPSGGTLVIDRTEAMTVVDVNTGKFTGSGGNLEQTVTRNNLEAAEEIVRQLRLRDIGGIVVIDFIDMVLESNRDLVLRRLTEALARDRTRHQVSEVTSLGLVQLTRKRLGTGLIEAFSTPCPHCAGRGILLHGDPVDSTATTGRKSESGGRRGKRGKKGGKADDVQVAKVPAHVPGEHPMFKAMAAANGRHEADEDVNGEVGDGEDTKAAEEVAELEPDTIREAVIETAEEDLEDEDFDEDSDEDTEDGGRGRSRPGCRRRGRGHRRRHRGHRRLRRRRRRLRRRRRRRRRRGRDDDDEDDEDDRTTTRTTTTMDDDADDERRGPRSRRVSPPRRRASRRRAATAVDDGHPARAVPPTSPRCRGAGTSPASRRGSSGTRPTGPSTRFDPVAAGHVTLTSCRQAGAGGKRDLR